jgi:EAL domain-containing protein (putative c-di-GMP-specific phosphodiesterase class I)
MDFVRDLVQNQRSRAVVAGIVGVAAGFGQRTIAEGVEDASTLALLRELGVDLAQGFHIGRPAPIVSRADR